MQLTKPSTFVLAALLASPALYGAFVTHRVETRTALIRLVIAIPVAALMLWLLRVITGGYGKPAPAGENEPVRAEAVPGEPLARRAADA